MPSLLFKFIKVSYSCKKNTNSSLNFSEKASISEDKWHSSKYRNYKFVDIKAHLSWLP